MGAETSAFKITAPTNLISDSPPSAGGLVENILGLYDDRITMIEGTMLNSISIIKLIKLALVEYHSMRCCVSGLELLSNEQYPVRCAD